MGKLKNLVNNIFAKEPPLDGGNFFTQDIELQVQDEISLSTIPKYAGDIATQSINAAIAEKTYSKWWLINFQANYFCNIFKIVCDNNGFNELLTKIAKTIRTGFFYGDAGMYIIDGLAYPVYISERKTDEYGNFVKLKLVISDFILAQKTSTPDLDNLIEITLDGPEEIEKHFVYFRFDTWGIGAWVKYLKFINQQEDFLKMIYTSSFSYLKKFIYSVNNPYALQDELKNFFNINNPFVFMSRGGDGLNNVIKEFENFSQDSTKLTDYYNEYLRIYYEMFGRRFNIDQKGERNLSGEIDASQASFDVLENDIKLWLNYFLYQLGLKLNVTLRIDEPKEEENNDA